MDIPFCFDISDVGGILLSLSNMVEICTLVWKMKQRLKKKGSGNEQEVLYE